VVGVKADTVQAQHEIIKKPKDLSAFRGASWLNGNAADVYSGGA
jgi:hypothetical protein